MALCWFWWSSLWQQSPSLSGFCCTNEWRSNGFGQIKPSLCFFLLLWQSRCPSVLGWVYTHFMGCFCIIFSCMPRHRIWPTGDLQTTSVFRHWHFPWSLFQQFESSPCWLAVRISKSPPPVFFFSDGQEIWSVLRSDSSLAYFLRWSITKLRNAAEVNVLPSCRSFRLAWWRYSSCKKKNPLRNTRLFLAVFIWTARNDFRHDRA